MKILWLGGIVLPRIAQAEGLPINNTNGWLISNSETIGAMEGTELVYLFDSPREIKGRNEFYSYYGVKCSGAVKRSEVDEFKKSAIDILNDEKPDLVHIWGTERPHTLAMVEACEAIGLIDKVVVSIQGLVSTYSEHYEANLTSKIVKRYTLRDLAKGNIAKGRRDFEKAGVFEKEALKKVKHVIGRTDWDRACVWNINPDAKYHFNNETLREEFYKGQWSYEACEKHSMFCSQGNYPIKGIHHAIRALSRIVKEYPDAVLYIGGKNYMTMPAWKISSYGKYIRDLIRELGLEDNVKFTGFLSGQQMKERYLRSNVFLSPSSIENSPNSLGEAMILGIPCVASAVGGVHNLLKDKEEGFIYPADEYYMISYYVCEIFKMEEQAIKIGEKARDHARITHNPKVNMETLFSIYRALTE